MYREDLGCKRRETVSNTIMYNFTYITSFVTPRSRYVRVDFRSEERLARTGRGISGEDAIRCCGSEHVQ